ncbi:alpha/beta hydrolase [Reichenbachiella sp. MALMAid0571]|uniref:alpha/beta hydrolase n=1 Tax=Reichenbachiella sp. MALMAid0571 TaxID=3143939 RepID=UPI0032DF1088
MKNKIALVSFVFIVFISKAQEVLPLYTGVVPNSKPYQMKEIELKKDGNFFGYKSISQPTLEVYFPDKKIATGTTVIICPGGGYGMESYLLEGIKIAKEFTSNGVTVFILKYRLPSDSIMLDKSIGPLQDAQQAIKMVRKNANTWNVDADKIGIMGFSAGGHLASTAGTHFDKSYIENKENVNLRTDFMILVYPVVSMTDDLTHEGSRTNLLGKNPDTDQILLFSNELQVTANTPPTWITHTGDDTVVPVDNSIRFYQALIRNKVSAEMHLYPKGNHGFVLSLPINEWMLPLLEWMQKSGFM